MAYDDIERFVYVLELADGCWYVGMCTQSTWRKRWWQHLSGNGSSWSQVHKPLKVAEKWPFEGDWRFGELLENKRFIEYALKYGAERVRGGHHCVPDTAPAKETLISEYAEIIRDVGSSPWLVRNGWEGLSVKAINTKANQESLASIHEAEVMEVEQP